MGMTRMNQINNNTSRQDSWIWEGILEGGTVNVLYGMPSCGKTMFCLELIQHIVDNKPFLEREVQSRNVKYFNSEMKLEDIKERLMKLNTVYEEKILISDFDFDLSSVKAQIEPNDFVIIDLLSQLIDSEKDLNSYQDIGKVFHPLKEIAIKTNSVILLVHHMNKRRGFLGSTGIDGFTDTRIGIENDSSNGNFRKITIHGKNCENIVINTEFRFPNFITTEKEETPERIEPFIARLIAKCMDINRPLVIKNGTLTDLISKLNVIDLNLNPQCIGRILARNQQVLEENHIVAKKVARGNKQSTYDIYYQDPDEEPNNKNNLNLDDISNDSVQEEYLDEHEPEENDSQNEIAKALENISFDDLPF